MSLFLDIGPISGGVGAIAIGAFLLIFVVVAYIAFRMLKKSVKMAFRLAIVAVILGVAVAGSVALWALGTGSSETQRPRTTRSR
jgi:hypothetical protein